MDIIICRLNYPNDPTYNVNAHQHFVGFYSVNTIILYSISSVLGKEKRVFDNNNVLKEEYYLIKGQEQIDCSLKMTSFIDCSKSYKIQLDAQVDITKLTNRNIPSSIKNKILNKINEMNKKGKNTEYYINVSDFIQHNPKIET